MKEITKELVITAFKNACVMTDMSLIMKRKMSVETQNQRNIWEISNRYIGLIRIREGFGQPTIELYPLLNNGYPANNGKPFEFNILIDEYNELKKLYFGNFKEDLEYLKKYKM